MVTTHRWNLRLPAVFGHADITPELLALVGQSGVGTGILTVQLIGSTGAITTIEYEPGALNLGNRERTRGLVAVLVGSADH